MVKSVKEKNFEAMGLKTGKSLRLKPGIWTDEHFPIGELMEADDPEDPFYHYTEERHDNIDADFAQAVAEKQVTSVEASQRIRNGKVVTLIVDGRRRKRGREMKGCETICVTINNQLTDIEVATAILESFRRQPMSLADRVQQVNKVFRKVLEQQAIKGQKRNEMAAMRFVADKLGDGTTIADVGRLVVLPHLHSEAQRLVYAGHPLTVVDVLKDLVPEDQPKAIERILNPTKASGTPAGSADKEGTTNANPGDPTDGLEKRDRLRRRPAQDWHVLLACARDFLAAPPDDATAELIAQVKGVLAVCEWWNGKEQLAELLVEVGLKAPAPKTRPIRPDRAARKAAFDLKTLKGRQGYDKAIYEALFGKGSKTSAWVKEHAGGSHDQARVALARLAGAGCVRITAKDSADPKYEATDRAPDAQDPIDSEILRLLADPDPAVSYTSARLSTLLKVDVEKVRAALSRLADAGLIERRKSGIAANYVLKVQDGRQTEINIPAIEAANDDAGEPAADDICEDEADGLYEPDDGLDDDDEELDRHVELDDREAQADEYQ